MRIEIEVSEFWIDQEMDIEKGLKEHIIESVISKIQNSIRKKIDERIVEFINLNLETKIRECITEKTLEVYKSEEIKINGEKTTIKDYIQKKIDERSWQSPIESIEKIARQYTEELKKQYDMFFASQIVVKMHENNLLKEDMAKLILENKGGK